MTVLTAPYGGRHRTESRPLCSQQSITRFTAMIIEKCSIVQIIPADGWEAVWKAVDSDDQDEYTAPLICWALVEAPDGERFVTGVDSEPGSTTGFVASDDNFKGYISPGGERKQGRAPFLE